MFHKAFSFLCLSAAANAHVVAWNKGMYCFNGTVDNKDPANTREAGVPLYNMTKQDWWFQHYQGCDLLPPKAGDFLNLPANGNVTVELAHSRGQTTLSFNGQFTSPWPGGDQHPEDWHGNITANNPDGCIQDDGLMHTHNETTASGTAFAISYNSNISAVTMENLVVFTVLEHTPWKRVATYQIPDLPACPPGGCHCAWLWVPRGCGEPNMYMAGYKCQVTGAKSTRQIGKAKPPAFCKLNQTLCTPGPKQMIAWHQKDGNNVDVPAAYIPMYNSNNGFSNGAQNDIFV